MTITAVIGLQYGDEGKGKIVDLESEKHDVVVRFNGGPNAGHTIVLGDKKVTLHLFPSGILHKKICVIGNGTAINLEKLTKECEDIESIFGFNPRDYLLISDMAHVILPNYLKSSTSDIHSTGNGIKETYTQKAAREGIRIIDLVHINHISCNDPRYDMIKKNRDSLDQVITQLNYFKGNVDNTQYFLNGKIKKGKNVLLEGAQAVMLDVNHGLYPFVTSSDCIPGGGATGAGVPMNLVDRIIGVAKVYTTRVDGNKDAPFPVEYDHERDELLRSLGNEFGATTKRPRRTGRFDIPQVKYAMMISGTTEVVLTKLDVYDGMESIQACIAYDCPNMGNIYPSGTNKEFIPNATVLNKAIPVYHEFSGWKGQKTQGVWSYEELPENAINYVQFLKGHLEGGTNAKVTSVCNGPERNNILHIPSSLFGRNIK